MLAEEVVFSMEEEPYRWRDVILAAVRWGDWGAVERRVRQGAAAMAHAEATDETIPSEELDEAGREFRYDRDLITAQGMEDWLSKWDLSVKEWMGYLSRELYRTRFASQADALARKYPIPDDEAARLTLIDAICAGDLDRWATTLAARVAVHARTPSSTETTIDESRASSTPGMGVVAAMLEADPETVAEATNRLEHLEDSFERFRRAQLTEDALQDYVGHHKLDWLRFDCRIMAFPEESMASEAAFLLREDDEGFTGVYSAAHAEPRAASFFLDEIEDSLRDRFLGAGSGDLLGPMRVNGEYVLYLVQAKRIPSTDDPLVRRRAEEGVLRIALSRKLDRQVKWRDALTR